MIQWEGRKLTEWINAEHENPKYLGGVRLPDNVVACPDLAEAARNASVLVFVLPHQFLRKRVCSFAVAVDAAIDGLYRS